MTANSSPNLFRLSLPEWLKEQVDSGKHKSVYWIDENEKIFHVPWKHASRNGWEDGDVSLFRAWAIYTNRYRVGIDKPKPALWKTNFRCAINSHNAISFLKDQGQRKGDKAHRIMKLIDPPKKMRKLLNSPDSPPEPARKLVRLTYPNFASGPDSKGRSRGTAASIISQDYEEVEICEPCSEMKEKLLFVLENAFKDVENLENNQDYLNLKSKYVECLTTKEHVCQDKNLTDVVESMFPSQAFVPSQDSKPKPNLEDLYFIGKALQSGDDLATLNVEIKLEHKADKGTLNADNLAEAIITSIEVKKQDEAEKKSESVEKNIIMQNKSTNTDINEEEDDLITPRD